MRSYSKRNAAAIVSKKSNVPLGSNKDHPCKLCSSTSVKSLYRDHVDAWICLDCCAVFIDSGRDIHAARQFYTSWYGSHLAFKAKSKRRIRRQLKWITDYAGSRKSPFAIEVGCANGQLLEALKNAGFQVMGIEPGTASSIIAGTKIGHDNVFQGFLETFETGSRFNLAILLHTFEHFEDPVNALILLHALLAEGGLLFLTVPNFYSFTGGFFRNWSSSRPAPSPNHAFVYTRRTLGCLVQTHGFELLESKGIGRSVSIVARKTDLASPEASLLPFDSPRRMLAFHLTASTLSRLAGKLNRALQRLGVRRSRKALPVKIRSRK